MPAKSSSQKWIFASFFAALLGLVDTAVLIAQHYKIANQGLLQKSFCTLSSFVDCDTALASQYARLGRIPNAELGFLFYIIIAFLSLWALVSEQRRRSLLEFLLCFSLAGTLYSFYMAYLLFGVLEILCLFCTASHLLTLAIFLFLLGATQTKIWKLFHVFVQYVKRTIRPPQESIERTAFMSYLLVAILIYGVGLLFFVGLNKSAHSGPPKFNRTALLRHFYAQQAVEIDVGNAPSAGPQDAPITIVEFSDFQCPFCRRAAFSLKPYLGQFRHEVRIVYLNFPLDNQCNPAVQRSLHGTACLAAKAAICSYQQQGNTGFWKFHDLLFENQKRLSRGLLTEELAIQIGMTPEQMRQCMISAASETRLSHEVELGSRVGVEGTPAVYINGRYLRRWVEPTILRTVIAAELERLKRERS